MYLFICTPLNPLPKVTRGGRPPVWGSAMLTVGTRIRAELRVRPLAPLTNTLYVCVSLLCLKVTQDCVSSSQARASQASQEEESNNTPSGWEFLYMCVCVCVCVFEGVNYSTWRTSCVVFTLVASLHIRCSLRVCSGVCTCLSRRCVLLCVFVYVCVCLIWIQPRRLRPGISDAAGQEVDFALGPRPSLWTWQHTGSVKTDHFICVCVAEWHRPEMSALNQRLITVNNISY